LLRYLTKQKQAKPRPKPSPKPRPKLKPRPSQAKPSQAKAKQAMASQGILEIARPDNAKEGADFDLCALHAAPTKSPLNEGQCLKIINLSISCNSKYL